MNTVLSRLELILAVATCGALVALAVWIAYQALTPDRPDSIANIMRDLAQDYSVPIAQSQGETLCQFVNPASGNPQCARVVQTLEESGPELDEAIEELGEHAYRRPNDPLLRDLLDILTLQGEVANQLVSSWNGGDDEAWSVAWTRLDEVDERWRSFYEELAKYADQRTVDP